LLENLPNTDRRILEPHLKDIAMARGTVLHERGEKLRFVYLPRTAVASLVVVLQSGEEIETATVGCEGIIGGNCAYGSSRTTGHAVVCVPGVFSRAPMAQFQKAMRESRALAEAVARFNDALLTQTQQTVACNAFHRVEARLCRWLLQIRDQTDVDFLPLTQEFLANMLGVRRTTVTLAARALQKAGLIRYRRGRIEIVDRKGLQDAACECYDLVHAQSAAAMAAK
jgi:CRP-like cAMP-binding protein